MSRHVLRVTMIFILAVLCRRDESLARREQAAFASLEVYLLSTYSQPTRSPSTCRAEDPLARSLSDAHQEDIFGTSSLAVQHVTVSFLAMELNPYLTIIQIHSENLRELFQYVEGAMLEVRSVGIGSIHCQQRRAEIAARETTGVSLMPNAGHFRL